MRQAADTSLGAAMPRLLTPSARREDPPPRGGEQGVCGPGLRGAVVVSPQDVRPRHGAGELGLGAVREALLDR